MAVIYLRHVLQRPLTFGELDANFDNLNNAILNLGLDDLTDVVITNGNNGDLLVFDGTNWVNKQLNLASAPEYIVTFDPSTGDFTYTAINPGATISSTAPTGLTAGALWFNDVDGVLYILYDGTN